MQHLGPVFQLTAKCLADLSHIRRDTRWTVCHNSFMSLTPPACHEKKFTCPRCGAFAQQDWKTLGTMGDSWAGTPMVYGIVDKSEAVYVADEDETPYLRGKAWEASLCGACEDHSLWIDERLVYPQTATSTVDVPAPHDEMPAAVLELYEEAAAVLPHSRRAAAALCRAALERLVKILTPELPTTLSLDGRLAALSTVTDNTTTKVLYVIRHVGNTALHGEKDGDESAVIYLDDDPENNIPDLFLVAINELVAERISRPRRIDALYEQLPQGVLSNIEQKMEQAKQAKGQA